ncbi:MAG: ATP-binding cassette domain-containing protein [Azospirillum sp.]|nr:ATP-binding cassette domain-containing protein [Azospirillum sp.]
MLELDQVSRTVGGESHLRDVSLRLEKGTLNVLLGATLSGKTSLLRVMAGLDRPSTGRLLVNGADVTGAPVHRRSVAMVYQQFINYPNLSVYKNIASPLRLAGLLRPEIEHRVRGAADLLRLTPLLDRLPGELSGGQQQRTAIARALVKGADLVLLDEPLANLDYKLREELREELPKIFAGTGAVLVYATTEPTEALLLGGHTATLHEGRVTAFGPTIEVFRRPNTLTTAQVFSDPPLNTIAADKRDGGFYFGSIAVPAAGALAGLPDGGYTIGFRPEHLYPDRPAHTAVEIAARVVITEITGSESFVHVAFAGRRWIALAHGVHDLAIDQTVSLFLDPARFLVFDRGGALAAAAA